MTCSAPSAAPAARTMLVRLLRSKLLYPLHQKHQRKRSPRHPVLSRLHGGLRRRFRWRLLHSAEYGSVGHFPDAEQRYGRRPGL